MKLATPAILLSGVLTLALHPVVSAPAGEMQPEFYAAVSMTKAQKNTSTPADSGLYAQSANGEWKLIGPRILGVASVAFHPRDSSIVLLASGDGVVRSVDAGKTWRKVTGWEVADVKSIVFDANNPSQVYATTAWGPLRSENAGETWELAQGGLDRLYCQTLLVDPRHARHVVLGGEEGLFASTDGAKTWQPITFPRTQVNRLARSESHPDTLVAVTVGKGAWLSSDNGVTWTATDSATSSKNLYAAAISPRDPAILATGGWGTGVRISSDGGRTWVDRTNGLPAKNIFVLAFDPRRPSRLWASTFEEGTYFSDDQGVTWKDGGLYGAYGSDFVFLTGAADRK